MSRSCQQITIDVPENLKDAVIGELSECGAAGFWENGDPIPGVTRLEVYFDPPMNVTELQHRIESIFSRANVAAPSIIANALADRDWLGEWKKSYVSFPIGRRFFIIPSWSDSECPPERFPIRIDPGQAFGTGTHETTQLTLEILESMPGSIYPYGRIMDLGIGSGILAIAARLLGFQSITGCDIDLDSVGVARENIERNSTSSHADIFTFCGSIDAVRPHSVDLLLCNLTADVIIRLFDQIDRAARPQCTAILSGILVEQRDSIRHVIDRTGWVIEDDRTRGEWIALRIRKP